jgi:predicted metalloprotease with PDZ domain
MNYKLSVAHPSSRYIQIEATTANPDKKEIEIQLPSWRPGRYELGNFAKNVRNFRAYDADGRELKTDKITKDKWKSWWWKKLVVGGRKSWWCFVCGY